MNAIPKYLSNELLYELTRNMNHWV